MDFFWTKLEEEYGAINLHLKNILNINNLCSQSLARLTRETIKLIEEDMRGMVESLKEEALTGGIPLREIYGRNYALQPENFRFTEGETLCLLDLADIINRSGISKILKKIKRKNAQKSQIISNDERHKDMELDNHVQKLQTKIWDYFASLNCQDGAFDSFREKMQDLRVEAYTTSGKIHAHVTCPICDDSRQSKISLNMDTTGSWHIFAFKRHCKTFHIQTPHSSKQKRRSVTPVATDDANENNCPIKRPSLESTGIGTACGILKRLNEVVHTNF
ncbi:hypothetical protein RP20_CCG005736 [Aedes albopictus]|nr:hypothetical protein RP20_CCG005736 [Aedes albopictus]